MVPLSRISFSIFLVHMHVISFIWGMTSDPFPFCYFELVLRLLLLYSCSIAVGYGVFLCFEAPFYSLMKHAFASPPAKPLHLKSKEGE